MKLLQVIVGLVPIATEHMFTKLCRRWMLQRAARLLHEHLSGALESNQLEMLTDEPDNVAICLVKMDTIDCLQIVIIVCVI